MFYFIIFRNITYIYASFQCNPDEFKTPPIEEAENDIKIKTSEAWKNTENKENTEVESAPEINNEVTSSSEISNENKYEDEEATIESFEDIDLGSIEIAANILEEMEKSLKPSEAYENLMGACSSTAQALKQTISDVLRTRESIVITDSTSELEQSLSQKIADFETVVNGSFVTRDVTRDAMTDLTNIKHPAFSNVIITEVDDSVENACSNDNKSTAQTVEETKSSPSTTSADLNSEAAFTESTNISDKDSNENSNKTVEREVKSTQTLPVEVNIIFILIHTLKLLLYQLQRKQSYKKFRNVYG